MNQETFQIFLWVMSAVALVVFIALYFVKAGYGMFRTASWGISINNKLAWVLMEAPVFILMFGLWGRVERDLPCRYISSSCCFSCTIFSGPLFSVPAER